MKRLISIVIGLCAACSLSFAQVDLDKEFFSRIRSPTSIWTASSYRSRNPTTIG